ncbi:Group II intron-encoded protein LtrA [Planctomycetes bacterium CA13]|uniref:Group II intron-encoded protein LtrA n=3 Tax=Novipirellula herctigrandis TaxID=2527986 RepID=A0A5C5YV55_9BACT|nr:Group II intron-encoded protein LtrA [Planctomycetes bacterium CA13]
MNSNRPKHTEPTSGNQQGAEDSKGPVAQGNLGSSASLTGHSDSASIEKPALNDVPLNLMEQIVDTDTLECAWARVKANRGAPGPDGIMIDEFPDHFRELWPVLRQQLLEGTYKPGPVRRKSIPKADGGERHLGIPNVVDRLVQQAILLVLTPIFDPEFSESSFGFRPYRSAHEAIHLVQTHIQAGYRWCVDMDLSKFFDRVQHDVLMHRVGRKVRDKRLLRLIGNYLRAGVMVDTDWQPSTEGTMQGGPLSPLLANILLDDFDKEMERRGHRFVRYADDFLVFSKTEQSATRVFRSVERYLTSKLKLVVNHDKSSVCSAEAVEFLGYTFRGFGGRFGVSRKNLKRFKERVKQITRRNGGRSIQSRLSALRRYFQGWVGYFHYGLGKKQLQSLDKWIRRRIRACYWKQWYRVRTRIRMLLKLGVRRDEAFSHGSSGRGVWVMSSSAAMHVAISKDYLRQQGLASLEEIWSKFASKKRTAGCGPACPVV